MDKIKDVLLDLRWSEQAWLLRSVSGFLPGNGSPPVCIYFLYPNAVRRAVDLQNYDLNKPRSPLFLKIK